MDVHLRPCFLGGIMNESGNQPPALVPSKGIYMLNDLQRLAKYFQVPLKEPKDFFEAVFKKGSLPAMRFVTAVEMEQPDFVEPVSREFWRRIWSTDEDITQPDSILCVAHEAGLHPAEAQRLLGITSAAEVKDQLKRTTAEALKYGSFGLPTIVAHVDDKPHMFFGSDRFELLADLLGEKWMGPVLPDQMSLL
ncbi:glutathione S-transferase kappa 1-like isoform X2 [Lissotriton helveticus]